MTRIDQQDLAAAYGAAVSSGDYARYGVAAPSVQRLMEQLWLYAWPTLLASMKTGDIADKLRWPVFLGDDEREALSAPSPETREDLAAEIIVSTYPRFLDRELGEADGVIRWDNTKAAQLGTWFVGACFLRAHDVLRRWAVERKKFVKNIDAELLDTYLDHVTFEGDLASREMARRLIRTAPHGVRPILSAIAQGESIESAASALKISAPAARGRLYEFRKRKVQWLLVHGVIDLELVPAGHRLRGIAEQILEGGIDDEEFDWEKPIDNTWGDGDDDVF